MHKLFLGLRFLLVICALIAQGAPAHAILSPAEVEEREAKKRKLVEATDHIISDSAIQNYAEERERAREAREDAPKKGESRWGGNPDDDEILHPEDEEFFEDKADDFDGGVEAAGGEDWDPNKKN